MASTLRSGVKPYVPPHILNVSLQLALYKSSRYLLPLQGDVVPYVMGVYTRPGKIDIAMELPHPVFWMEASASMPVVLKDCVVEAFRKLHERGIVHGDVALRHILIGADARVTLIDFQASRADEPNEELDLAMTYPGEKDLEIRRVKFLLNMDNARKKEFKRSKAALKRSERNKRREQRRRELLRHGITTGLPLDEPEPLEDINKPPVPLDELERYWMEDANDDPRRFIVPGTSETEVAEAISSFLRCIKGMEGADCDWSIVCNAPSSPRSPLASPSLSPRNDNASITELPSSIKVRDFAYESAYWSPIPRPQEELGTRNHATSPLSVEKGKISGDRAIVLSDSKRHREDDEERCACVEGLPTGKTPRPDDCQSLISRPQEELGTRNHDPPSPLSVEKRNISDDRAIILSHSPTHLKRHREEDEERAAYVEGLPTGKRPRADDCRSVVSRPQEELGTRNHGPPSPLSVEKRNISGDRAIILSHPPTHLKRHREDEEERAPYVEGLPAGKRPRPDDCRSPISCPEEERGTRNHDPSSPLSVERGSIPGDSTVVSPTHMKRHRKDEEENAACVEGLPTGKKLRLDDSSSKECDLAVIAVTDIHSES
jgi:tRNA A-37 threonylcarbamoyl transferase component Bud32